MLYEIDFLPVGEGEQSGDAICLRYSFDQGTNWSVGVIDGGTQESGESLCKHIDTYYKTNIIDFLVCTHPDQDHASGLSCVLEKLTVKKVLMHCSWDYVDYIYDYVSDGRVTKESVKNRLIEGHPYAYKVYELANKKNVPIFHAFSDSQDHDISCLLIAGPSSTFYLQQLINFRSITDVTEDIDKGYGLLRGVMVAAKKAANWIIETWDDEKLVDPEDDATSSENNSGIILHFDFDGKKVLLTGDCGVPALAQSADYIESQGIELQPFSFIQVPHHGSKRNIGPTILNKLVGPPLAQESESNFTALISATKTETPKHPNKRVVNAFIRRGGKVIATQGSRICHHSNGTPDRGWSKAEPLPFYPEVEEDNND